mgnify:CR=1 FL=1
MRFTAWVGLSPYFPNRPIFIPNLYPMLASIREVIFEQFFQTALGYTSQLDIRNRLWPYVLVYHIFIFDTHTINLIFGHGVSVARKREVRNAVSCLVSFDTP